MIVQLARFVLLTAGALGGFAVARLADWPAQTGFSEEAVIILFIILGSAMGYLFGGIFGRELTEQYRRLEQHVLEFETTDIILASAGLVIGLIVAYLVSEPLRLLRPSWVAFLAIVTLYVLLGYAGTRLFLTKRHDVHRRFGGLVADSAPPGGTTPKIIDTSAIIDGRLGDVVRSGFMEGPLRVPRFVLAELHTLADSADDIKRARGRRGLDMLAQLSGSDTDISVYEADYPEEQAVDAKLVRLAGSIGGTLVTVDHNLTQVARVQGVPVLNLNELASALRPLFLPGDEVRVSLIREGKEEGQGVGYLEDGTMVVVAEGKPFIGRVVDAQVTSVLQTAAGRMIFARVG